ncbi:hypothetical protein [Sphingomicrobium nitratireducens]|uniref:hypothetical protein n=1 Tax=Sphingomicrobium nitratireducens TaxID=2964666 RepID=UPI00223EFEB9|nr:hypothetical protein [Sphingomicrobium nitratireducens]
MKLNARKFATSVIALLIVWWLYGLASDGETVLAGGFGASVAMVGFMFRRAIFGVVHRHVESVVDGQAQRLFSAAHDEPEAFDADEAFARYMANRKDEVPAEPAAPAMGQARARPAFGRKRV